MSLEGEVSNFLSTKGTDDNSKVDDDAIEDELDDEESGEEEGEEDEDDEGEEEEEDEDEPSELEALKIQNAKLLEALAKVSGDISDDESTAIPKVNEEGFKKLFDEMDMDKITDSKEDFVEFLQTFADLIGQNTLAKSAVVIQELNKKQAKVSQSNAQIKKEFYTAHPELQPVESYVGKVASSVARKMEKDNPNATLQEVLDETAKVVKASLGLSTKTVEKKKGKGKNPALPKKGSGGRKAKVKHSKLQSQIDDLL